MNFIVVAYYTKNTLYEKEVLNLISSLEKFNIPHDVVAIDSRGDWYKNINFKPTFIKQQMLKHSDKAIVYVDADAVFMSYPKLFLELTCDIAVHEFNKQQYYRHSQGIELLSGTLFFNNSEASRIIVDTWEKECINNSKVWDQINLQNILKSYQVLPPEYCTIFDTMRHVNSPVIIHYQASRKARKLDKLNKLNKAYR